MMRLIAFIFLFSVHLSTLLTYEITIPEIKIALITDGKSDQVKKFRDQFIKEINALLEGEFAITFAPLDEYTGDWTSDSINALIDRANNDPTINIIVTTGVIGSDILALRTSFPKPTFAPFVIDEFVQQFPRSQGKTNIHNFNYLRPISDADQNLKTFHEIIPFHQLAILIDEALIQTVTDINSPIMALEQQNDVEITLIPINGNIDGLNRALTKGRFDAVYIASASSLDRDDVEDMIKLLIDLKLPSYSHYGKWLVEDGLLATTATDLDRIMVARRIAINIQRTLLGEDPKDFSVFIKESSLLTINMTTARAIGVSVPLRLILEANLLHALNETPSQEITLTEAVYEMLNNNLDLAISERDVYAGREDVNISRSRLMPQVEISAFGRIIDRDRAIGANGREPQSALFGEASASQVVYNNELMGDVRVQTHVQCARVEDYFRTKLDTIFDLSVTYLNYLRNRTVQEIQRNNLMLTRSNLSLARQRVEVGVARYSEIYRWESEIATNQTSVVVAFYSADTSRIRLNKIMNRSQATMTLPIDVTLKEPYWLIDADWFDTNIHTYKDLETYKTFAVLEGMILSPEIKELTQLVRAQAERLGITNRAIWQPSLSLIGEWSDRFADGGAGTKPLSALTPTVDKTDWLVGFSLNFPLYEGGGKVSRQRRAFQTLMGQKLELKNLAELVEEAIRVNINKATGSYAAIGYAQNSAKAANKNLELVTEQYSRGTTNIVDLLDAQNQALIADLTTANAIYDFLIDVIAVQRAIGRYDFMMPENEKLQWLKYLDIYLQKHGVKR
jgi:outer membrane protein